MTNPTQSTKKPFQWIGGGCAIIFIWYVVNFYPGVVAKWAGEEPGKTIFFWISIFLFGAGAIAIFTVLFLLFGMFKGIKIRKIKIRGVEINFDDDNNAQINVEENGTGSE